MASATNPVYEFRTADGTVTGCGTELERDYWDAELGATTLLGPVIGHEPASEDARRKAVWAREAA